MGMQESASKKMGVERGRRVVVWKRNVWELTVDSKGRGVTRMRG